MSRKVVSVESDCPIVEVLNKLRAFRISCLVVCDDDIPVGIISERDIVGVAYNCLAGSGEEREHASDLMSPSITTVNVNDSFDDTVVVAEEQRIRHLPVVDEDGRLVGLLTQTDLLRAALENI